jgi:hypothetical protein
VDTRWNGVNCGGCGIQCHQSTCCNSRCTMTSTDSHNCGKCGADCQGGTCFNGSCGCPSSTTKCPLGGCCPNNTVCADTANTTGCCSPAAPLPCDPSPAFPNDPNGWCCPLGTVCCNSGCCTVGDIRRRRGAPIRPQPRR